MASPSAADAAPLDVRQLIDDRPVSRYQVLVAVMCGLIVFVDGFDAQAVGFVAPALTEALDVPRSLLGPVISSGLVGMMAGALLFGPLADRIGRKPVLVGSVLVFGIGSLLTATTTTVEGLSTFRLLTGLGMGGAMPNAVALTSEYMPRRRRATAVTLMFCGFSFGAAVGGFVAAAVIPRFGWQSVFVIGGAIPLVIAAAAAVILPESIRFLLASGRPRHQAEHYIARLFPDVSLACEIRAGGDADPATRGFLVRRLFTGGRGVVTLLIWTIYFTNLLDLYFLNSWLPTIMSDSGIPVGTAIRITALFQIGGMAGAVALGRVLDRWRSFNVLALCFLWAAVWIAITGEIGTSVPWLIGSMLASGIGVIGGQTAAHALTSEFYPTVVRSTGVGWALGIGRIGSIVGPLAGGFLLTQGGGVRQVFWAAAIPALVAAAAAAAIAIRTSRRERPVQR